MAASVGLCKDFLYDRNIQFIIKKFNTFGTYGETLEIFLNHNNMDAVEYIIEYMLKKIPPKYHYYIFRRWFSAGYYDYIQIYISLAEYLPYLSQTMSVSWFMQRLRWNKVTIYEKKRTVWSHDLNAHNMYRINIVKWMITSFNDKIEELKEICRRKNICVIKFLFNNLVLDKNTNMIDFVKCQQ